MVFIPKSYRYFDWGVLGERLDIWGVDGLNFADAVFGVSPKLSYEELVEKLL